MKQSFNRRERIVVFTGVSYGFAIGYIMGFWFGWGWIPALVLVAMSFRLWRKVGKEEI